MKITEPWMGSQYSCGGINGKKILIVGESAYKRGGYPAEYDESRHTLALAADAIGYDEGRGYWNKSRFYTRIARIFGYNPHSYESRKALWHSLAYCNFIPEILSGPRINPQARHWDLGKQSFPEVLRLTGPDIAICLSKRMWVHIKKSGDLEIEREDKFYARKAGFDLKDGSAIPLLSFKHPTAPGFKWVHVKEILNEQITGAEPVVRANGPERPRLILNVGQK
ncbi:MAG TPA: hypothetical protein VK717_13235 [Opitutaceae bacterium]|nr:hypothetical protein [Opitutaceae bacterium]